MKQSDITPEAIRLSKEIAKYWRMEIYEGCWFWDAEVGYLFMVHEVFDSTWVDDEYPIPSISDCLEKLGNCADIKVVHEALLSALLEVVKHE